MSNTARIGIIAAVAVVVFGGAFLLFRDSESGTVSATDTTMDMDMDMDMDDLGMSADCATDAPEDASYAVSLVGAVMVDSPTFDIEVTHNGSPVTDAVVCFGADMTGMSHPPVSAVASPMSGGQYQFEAKFSMRGHWEGAVTVATADGATASVPFEFDVS